MQTPQADSRTTPYANARTVAFGIIVLLVVVVAVRLHVAAALTLPVPWGDEAFFVWQARAFQHHNSFVAPELYPGRPVLLLPFVYQGILGAVFKVFGYSLTVARALSLVFLLSGFAALALMARRQLAPLTAIVLTAAVLLNGHFVMMGNVARMEPFFFMMLCVSLLLLDRGELWRALAVLSVTPMIHPNGILYLIPLLIYAAFSGARRRTPVDRGAKAMFAVSALVWLANGLYALKYWEGFKHDTALRFGEMGTGNTGVEQVSGWYAVGLAGIVAVGIMGAWRKSGVGHFIVFAVAGWFASRLRTEQWYEPFGDLGYLLAALAVLQIIGKTSSQGRWAANRTVRIAATAAAAIAFLALAHRRGFVDGPRNYLRDTNVAGMRFAEGVPYFESRDGAAMKNFFDSVEPQRPITVEVYPWGDALLMAELDTVHVRFQIPYFDPVSQPEKRWIWGYRPPAPTIPDIFLIRYSRHVPGWLVGRHKEMLDRALKLAQQDSATMVYSRDSTERWYAVRTQRKPN